MLQQPFKKEKKRFIGISLKTEVEIAVEAPRLMILVKWVQIDKNKEASPSILINCEKVFSSLSNEE
jgi:hypothetical protein